MSTLESRKKLLLAASEINRAQFSREWHTMTAEAKSFARQAGIVSSLAVGVASLVGGLVFAARKVSAPVLQQPSRLQRILGTVQMAGALWSALRKLGKH